MGDRLNIDRNRTAAADYEVLEAQGVQRVQDGGGAQSGLLEALVQPVQHAARRLTTSPFIKSCHKPDAGLWVIPTQIWRLATGVVHTGSESGGSFGESLASVRQMWVTDPDAMAAVRWSDGEDKRVPRNRTDS